MQDFKGRKILITGITGFIGSHLSKTLAGLGANVFGLSRGKEHKNQEATLIEGNILDYNLVDDVIKGEGIDICYHLAGESLVEAGQEDPYETFKINTEGTLNILEAARKNKLERVIIASTSHVYGKNKVPYYEGYTPRPTRPYETSKACTDLIAQSYADTYNLPVLIPRFVNIYGPHDLHFKRLIPRTMKTVIEGKSPKMWGGSVVRDYLFIDDALQAYLLLAKIDLKKVRGNRIFNFGSGNRISVKNLIEKIIALSGKKLTIEKIGYGRTDEIPTQYVAFSKALRLLDWKPRVSLDEGLRRTLVWYKRYFKA